MHIAVLGAGVIGLTTSWYLAMDGHRVTVIDQHAGPGLGTSYANGAQLSYSYVAPLAGPGVLSKIPPWLLRSDSPLRFKPALDWHQWRWLAAFVAACNRAQSDLTMRRLLRLSFFSRALMDEFVHSDAGRAFDFEHARNGKLVVYSDPSAFDGARRLVDYQRSLGCEQTALDADAVRALEPSLAEPSSGLARRLVGAIHTPSEEVGDCHAFCVGIERLLRERGVAFDYGMVVERMRVASAGSKRYVAGLETPEKLVEADAYVLASGTASRSLVRPLGIDLPIYPLKGYSITVPGNVSSPRISITDAERRIVYAPLGVPPSDGTDTAAAGELRIAGMADIAGHRNDIDPSRLAQLVHEARTAFPKAIAPDGDLRPWSGLRPATPKGTPILGATAIPNLFVNLGHGALGWTLALGSARAVADVVGGATPAIDLEGLRVA